MTLLVIIYFCIGRSYLTGKVSGSEDADAEGGNGMGLGGCKMKKHSFRMIS